MAKSATADQTIYFKAVPWSIGDKSGLYSQVMKNEPVKNLDVAKEVVDTRHLRRLQPDVCWVSELFDLPIVRFFDCIWSFGNLLI